MFRVKRLGKENLKKEVTNLPNKNPRIVEIGSCSKILIFSKGIFTEGKLSTAIGIRYFEIAKSLAKLGNDVVLIELNHTKDVEIDGIPIIGWNKSNIKKIAKNVDICIISQPLAEIYFEKVKKIPTIVDMVVPVQLEQLSESYNKIYSYGFCKYLYVTALSLSQGDFFICAGEKQRLYYLGMLTALGRINPVTYNKKMIDIVPQAAPSEKAEHTKNVFRGKIVDENDKVILWAGGIYSWYDAETLIKAMKKVVSNISNAKLIFVGAKNPMYAPSNKGYLDAFELSKNLGLLNKNIFFTDWLPYNERANMYFESDVAVSTHKEHLEAELSFRTRIVDMLWGGLPVITSERDEMSDYIEKYEAGRVVKIGNYDMLADAIIGLLSDDDMRKRMSGNARRIIDDELSWDKAVKPIDEFCKNPKIAEDKIDELAINSYLSVTMPRYSMGMEIKSLLYHAKRAYKKGGLKELKGGVQRYVKMKRLQ